MKLIDANPRWTNGGGEGIGHVMPDGSINWNIPQYTAGIEFDCPCGKCGVRCALTFKNPIEPNIPGAPFENGWLRTGLTFENLTLSPSIWRNVGPSACGWHGFLKKGEFALA